MLFVALVFRLFLANFGTLQLDHGTFVAWANSLALGGFKNFYNGWSDYLPGYLYILWVLGKINIIFPNLQTILFKTPAIIADLLTGYLIYKIVGNLKDKKWALASALIYLFNPAIFANSSLWGQVDSLTSLFSLFSLYIFPYSFLLSAVSLALGTLTKPQAAFILPAVLYLFVKNRKKLTDYFAYSFVGLSVFALGFLPFSNQSNLFKFILERLTISSGQYPYGSVNAFSAWGLMGFWKPDNVTFWIGLVLSLLLSLTVLTVVFKKNNKGGEYIISYLSLLVTFLFMTRMHERHLLPTLAPLVVSASLNPMLFLVYGGLSLTYVANLSYAYYWITDNFKEIFNPVLIKFFIISNISLFIISIVSLFKKVNIKFNLKFKNFKNQSLLNKFESKDISKKKAALLLSGVLLFSLVTRIYSLNLPDEMYFDEIYHAFTAKLVLHNDPKAWEFWNPNPEGFAYEWTHPPISKLGMCVGMKIFGESPFGWRVPQAILGTFSVLLVYLIAQEIFKDRLVGILSSIVFSLDGLPLVLSRMGMNDTYVLLFSLLSVYFFIKNKNFWSAFSFGLAIASKWSGIYTFPIIFVSHFVFRKKIKLSYLSFLVIPILVYIASYGVMFATGHTWSNFIETQKQMWWYHTNLVATHPYTSPAWSWPLLLRPIYLYDGNIINGLVARIYAFGNPLVFWFGLFSVILSMAISFKEKNKKLGFVVFSYLIFFLPWIMSPRIMFLYHYLPSIPFLAIASGFTLRRYPKNIKYYMVIGLCLFIYFYPHWIGMRIPVWLDESYYWFSSWR
jgi:predicted membrane-bound dolichyl-phosphate-mannose-protein mannosyltransferase